MNPRKRTYILILILLICTLCLSKNTTVRAVEAISSNISSNTETKYSTVSLGQTYDTDDLLKNSLSQNEANSSNDQIVYDDSALSSNNGVSLSSDESELLSSNQEFADQHLTIDDKLSSNSLSANESPVSDNQILDEKPSVSPINILLPSSVSFNMLFIGDEKLNGTIDSTPYAIENKGCEDIIVSLHASCRVKNPENYFFQTTSVRNESMPDKKNVFLFLKWLDKNGKPMNLPETTFDNNLNSTETQIILKAPMRNEKGDVIGDNPQSKIYFSFSGNIKSNTHIPWESNELELELSFLIESTASRKPLSKQGN